MPEIGESLREARMRARIDVSEIEAKTKIRAKYLRALENEEWGLLPGPTFVKSFLRTYAQALGLDGKALVEEYRLNHETPTETGLEPVVASPRHARTPGGGGSRPGGTGPSRAYMALVGFVVVIIILLIVALVSGGSSKHGGSSSTSRTSAKHARTHARHAKRSAGAGGAPALVTLSLRPRAIVYVCLIGDGGRKLIPGVELQPGASTPTYHARRFEITLGNSSVTMIVDGSPRSVPPSSQAIGYTITKAAGRRPLRLGQLPTCT
ncbi:MAG: helix-turn-helix domain-containing protein [Actinobacteria bacterium]|nr:MAG: helix-turn-helix domain-containing protein [Actinomycetota bacterium]